MTPALAAYQPDIAPNLGAMIRLSACFGAALHVIGPCGFPLSDKTLKRAALDYGPEAELSLHTSWEAFQPTRRQGRLILLSTKAEQSLWDCRFRGTDILLMGRETAGVPEDIAALTDLAIRIPMPGGGRSLNVAMAAGIALSEAMRQLQAR